MPATTFQAFILCGPGALRSGSKGGIPAASFYHCATMGGEGLSPFNANPKDSPKALIPIANRPMVWYPLEWCYKTGISNITLITASDGATALESALQTNPYLTSLPHPRPTVLAPEDLTLTTGTAEIFRLEQVQDAITTDFVVLPCDIVCEIPGTALLETYMIHQASLGAPFDHAPPSAYASQPGRGGGLGLWYEIKDKIETGSTGGVGVKKEDTDFLATVSPDSTFAAPRRKGPEVQQVVMTMPTDTLKDVLEEQQALRLRRRLLLQYGRVRMHMTKRDAHVYLFPYWVKDFVRRNERFESLSEDLLGWWARSTWQRGLGEKLGVTESLEDASKERTQGRRRRKSSLVAQQQRGGHGLGVDVLALSSTGHAKRPDGDGHHGFASRVGQVEGVTEDNVTVPPLLTYLHPALDLTRPAVEAGAPSTKRGGGAKSAPNNNNNNNNDPEPLSSVPLVRRLDTTTLLLSGSLYLARLPPLGQPGASPSLSHPHKVHPGSALPQQATVDQRTVLVDANCTLQPRITLRECVVGANVSIASGSRLTRCVVMPDAVIDEKCILTGCIVGRRCRIGRESELKGCQVSDSYVVPEKTSEKDHVFAGFEEGDALMEGGGGEFDDDEDEDDDDAAAAASAEDDALGE